MLAHIIYSMYKIGRLSNPLKISQLSLIHISIFFNIRQ